jgi:hypothetical protein
VRARRLLVAAMGTREAALEENSSGGKNHREQEAGNEAELCARERQILGHNCAGDKLTTTNESWSRI